MDGVTLLLEARSSGLTVRTDGDRLMIGGPRSAEPLAQRLIAHKPAVMAALTDAAMALATVVPDDLPADWHEQWQERVSIMVVDGELPVEVAEFRALADVLLMMRRAGDSVTRCEPRQLS